MGDWFFEEEGTSNLPAQVAQAFFIIAAQAFFMGMFFLISAYFTADSYDRKGGRAFLIDRLKRLGIPLLLFFFIINPLTTYAAARGRGFYFAPGFRGRRRDRGIECRATLVRGGAAVLCAALCAVAAPARSGPGTHRRATPWQPSDRAIWARAGSGGVSAAAGNTGGLLRRAISLSGSALGAVHLYVVGVVAYQRNWPRLSDAQAAPWRWAALVLLLILPVFFLEGGAIENGVDPFMGGLHWQAFIYAVWEQLAGLAIIITLLTWFRRRLNQQSAPFKAASDATFATYVFHPVVLVLLALALAGIQLDLSLKFLPGSPVRAGAAFGVGWLCAGPPWHATCSRLYHVRRRRLRNWPGRVHTRAVEAEQQ